MPDIEILTAATMNGWKPIIFMEEAGVDYDLTPIDLGKRVQKEAGESPILRSLSTLTSYRSRS